MITLNSFTGGHAIRYPSYLHFEKPPYPKMGYYASQMYYQNEVEQEIIDAFFYGTKNFTQNGWKYIEVIDALMTLISKLIEEGQDWLKAYKSEDLHK